MQKKKKYKVLEQEKREIVQNAKKGKKIHLSSNEEQLPHTRKMQQSTTSISTKE